MHVYTCLNVSVCLWVITTYACVCICMCMCRYIYECVCICVCVHMCECLFIGQKLMSDAIHSWSSPWLLGQELSQNVHSLVLGCVGDSGPVLKPRHGQVHPALLWWCFLPLLPRLLVYFASVVRTSRPSLSPSRARVKDTRHCAWLQHGCWGVNSGHYTCMAFYHFPSPRIQVCNCMGQK